MFVPVFTLFLDQWAELKRKCTNNEPHITKGWRFQQRNSRVFIEVHLFVLDCTVTNKGSFPHTATGCHAVYTDLNQGWDYYKKIYIGLLKGKRLWWGRIPWTRNIRVMNKHGECWSSADNVTTTYVHRRIFFHVPTAKIRFSHKYILPNPLRDGSVSKSFRTESITK
jgi:hypothetical protein